MAYWKATIVQLKEKAAAAQRELQNQVAATKQRVADGVTAATNAANGAPATDAAAAEPVSDSGKPKEE